MKKLLLGALLLLSSLSFSQIHLDSLYKDKEKLLLVQIKDTIKDISEKEIMLKIENYINTEYSPKELKILKTENQIVLRYSLDFYRGENSVLWRFKTILKVKEGIILIETFDEGNDSVIAQRIGNTQIPKLEAGRYLLRDYFKNKWSYKNDRFDLLLDNLKNMTTNIIESAKKE